MKRLMILCMSIGFGLGALFSGRLTANVLHADPWLVEHINARVEQLAHGDEGLEYAWRSGFASALLSVGSVSRRLYDEANCSVLTGTEDKARCKGLLALWEVLTATGRCIAP